MKVFYFVVQFLIILTVSCTTNDKKDIDSNATKDVQRILNNARIYYNNEEYEKALVYFNQIVNMDTTIGEVYYSRAYCYGGIDEYHKSNNDYLKAISLDYKVYNSYFNLGCSYAIMRNDSVALIYFKKAYEVNPKDEVKEEILILEGKKEILF